MSEADADDAAGEDPDGPAHRTAALRYALARGAALGAVLAVVAAILAVAATVHDPRWPPHPAAFVLVPAAGLIAGFVTVPVLTAERWIRETDGPRLRTAVLADLGTAAALLTLLAQLAYLNQAGDPRAAWTEMLRFAEELFGDAERTLATLVGLELLVTPFRMVARQRLRGRTGYEQVIFGPLTVTLYAAVTAPLRYLVLPSAPLMALSVAAVATAVFLPVGLGLAEGVVRRVAPLLTKEWAGPRPDDPPE